MKHVEQRRNIALKIAYRGRDFSGWQCQPHRRTVEGELREALSKLHQNGENIKLYAAGRTDSGVHATGQVANFYSEISATSLPAHRFREALNSLLPKDLRILQSWEAAGDFHARYSARVRIYLYRIIQGESHSPEQRQNAWYVRAPQLDTTVLNCMVSALLGEHDFSAFAVAGDQAKTKVRRLYAASFYNEGPYLVFRIVGNAFLWHMVRSIIGTTVGLYRKYFKELQKNIGTPYQPYEEIFTQRYVLHKKMAQCLTKNEHSGFKAPAHGLTLSQVLYASTANETDLCQ